MFLLVLHIAAAGATGGVVVVVVVVVAASVLDTFPPQTLGNQPNQTTKFASALRKRRPGFSWDDPTGAGILKQRKFSSFRSTRFRAKWVANDERLFQETLGSSQ